MLHDMSYQAAISGSLAEWSQGSSTAKSKGAAGGLGFASGGFVLGGGAARGSANSSSQQSGGRTTTASEESKWRDSIRRHGDSLRKLESMVVQELNQEESVTGTAETLRNINYGHSLTVIYHNILRHLRVDTEFAGARECLFVPFAIRPFTEERALRWRKTISQALLEQSFSPALTSLKDVATNFAASSIPPGRSSDHPLKSLRGSVYLNLAIARPADKEDGKFDAATWKMLAAILPAAATAMYQSLAAVETRDQMFQQRYAPSIAAGWCNTLQLFDSRGTSLAADFTLATPYKFNSTVRVDFQASSLDGASRETLGTFSLKAQRDLAAGSKANVKAINIEYETDFFKGSIHPGPGVADLINIETGAIDPEATFTANPSPHERQDLRQELRLAARGLVDHLNENVEHYHKAIWWNMDRDRLFMLLDGFTIAKHGSAVSIANVVERDPVAVAGNCLVFRVSAGSFLGNPELSIETPDHLYDYYDANRTIAEPMHISLPTDGLYAQAIMDECSALEDHHGNHDWALTDPDPELTAQDPTLLLSRKSEPQNTTPTALPGTIINLSNATPAPSPQGLVDVLAALQNPNAFKDMAGLSGTQQLAQSSLNTAATLATSFGNSAAALENSRIASKQQATADADRKVASIQQARDKRLISSNQAAGHANEVLGELAGPKAIRPPYEDPDVQGLLNQFLENDAGQGNTFETSNAAGKLLVTSGDGGSVVHANAAARPRTRPTWRRFQKVYWNYVEYTSQEVLKSIEERWAQLPQYQNTCSLRLTKALNEYGLPISASANRIPGVTTDLSFQTKQRYILSVNGLRAYLLHHWGPPEVSHDKQEHKSFDPASHDGFKGKPGVIIFQIDFRDPVTNVRDATGHADLWYGDKFSHEKPGGWDGLGTPPKDYWSRATNIMLWHLKDPMGASTDSDSGSVVV